MLIEIDEKGEKVLFTYLDNPFYFSKKYIIGEINIADRSLAMIEYDLRKRFIYRIRIYF